MFDKNRNKTVGICVMVVTACLILAGLWAVLATPETALANPPDGDGNHNHGGGDDGGTYFVTVSGDVSSTTIFTGKDGGGRSKPVNVYFQFIDLDLTFFSNEKIDDDENCFAGAPLEGNLTAMTISQEKDGSAIVGYWFTGFGDDATKTEINYLLWMFGEFHGNWPPAETGDKTTFVDLTSWEMTTESKKNKNISCTGSGDFDDGTTIKVERTE